MCVYIRRPYIPGPFCRSPFRAKAKPVIIGGSKNTGMPLSVSTYSYTGDMYTLITLEDFMADAADMGATGIEMLAEANLPGYPDVSAEWKASWFALLEKYQLTPTNLGTWIDTARWHSRDLTADEGAAQLCDDFWDLLDMVFFCMDLITTCRLDGPTKGKINVFLQEA